MCRLNQVNDHGQLKADWNSNCPRIVVPRDETKPRTSMRYKRSDYLHFSEQCVLISRRVSSPEHRKFLLEMAASWRKLADCVPDEVDREDLDDAPADEN